MVNRKLYIYTAMVFAMISFGISWPTAKIVGGYANPQDLLAWRFFFALIAMAIFMKIGSISFEFPLKSIKYIIFTSAMIVIYNYNYLKGTQVGMASLGGVIVPTTSPIITFLLGLLLYKKKLLPKEALGLILGFFGVLLLVRFWEIDTIGIINSGNIFFIFAALSWSCATIATQKSQSTYHPINFSFWLYAFSMFMTIPFLSIDSILLPFNYDSIFWINFLIISVVVLGFGNTAYFLSAMKLGSGKASSFMFIVPFSAVLSSSLLLGEIIAATTIAGGLLTLIAVILINK